MFTWQCQEWALACITDKQGCACTHCISQTRTAVSFGDCPWPVLADNISPNVFGTRKDFGMKVVRVCKPIRAVNQLSYFGTSLITYAYISPRNILRAFKANACLHPATSKPVSSRFVMVFDAALAAFHRVLPQSPIPSIFYISGYSYVRCC